ncbi:MAG: cytochrome C oxidase subunit IV family protein [Planctomycetota bacterium]
MSQDKHFNANKVFIGLIILTAVEVAYGVIGGRNYLDLPKGLLWGGLIFMAIWKALLIAWYFMHLKFEGWIVKGLILPTPFLIAVIFGYVLPDLADDESNLVYPIGSMVEAKSGAVYEHMSDLQKHVNPDAGH